MSPEANALLARLRRSGFTLRDEAGKLVVTPGNRLSAEDRIAVTRLRDPLLDLVRAEHAEDVLDRLTASGWQPRWGPGHPREQPAVLVTLAGVSAGWHLAEWEAFEAFARRPQL